MFRRLPEAALTRSRAYTLAAVTIVTILVLQMVTTVVGALLAARQFESASIDTFEYIGELTVERVARYSMGARDVVDGTVGEIESLGDNLDRDELEASLHRRLVRDEEMRSVYVGWPDGEFMVLRREGAGFVSQRGGGEHGDFYDLRTYDASFSLLETSRVSSEYDPRTRPWYVMGTTTGVARWTNPYLEFGTRNTLVSVANSARIDGSVSAVVGADLSLEGLAGVLDGLPYGEGAEAFVLSRDLKVIAAPSAYDDALAEIVATTGAVPYMSDLGIAVDPLMVKPGEARFSRDFDRITLDRGFPLSETVPWRLHMVASDDELSAGLGGLGVIVLWITAFSFLAVIVVAGVVWWVRHPLSRLRERAMTDPLTGLLNRHEFYRRGKLVAKRAGERGGVLMMTVMDLDDFKNLNDEQGHVVGDQALAAVASALENSARTGDLSARIGGDEFAVLHVLREGDRPMRIVQRVRDAVESEIHSRVEGSEGVGVTAGYATGEPGVDDLNTLMARADEALIGGKRIRKGAVYGSIGAVTEMERRRRGASSEGSDGHAGTGNLTRDI